MTEYVESVKYVAGAVEVTWTFGDRIIWAMGSNIDEARNYARDAAVGCELLEPEPPPLIEPLRAFVPTWPFARSQKRRNIVCSRPWYCPCPQCRDDDRP